MLQEKSSSRSMTNSCLVSLKFGSMQVLLYDFMCHVWEYIFLACNNLCVFNLIYMQNAGWFWQGIVLSYVWHIGYILYIFFESFIWHLWLWLHGFMWHTSFNEFYIITLLLSPRDTDVLPLCSVMDWAFWHNIDAFYGAYDMCHILLTLSPPSIKPDLIGVCL